MSLIGRRHGHSALRRHGPSSVRSMAQFSIQRVKRPRAVEQMRAAEQVQRVRLRPPPSSARHAWSPFPERGGASTCSGSKVRRGEHHRIAGRIALGDRRSRPVLVAPALVEEVAHGAHVLHRVAGARIGGFSLPQQRQLLVGQPPPRAGGERPFLELHHAAAEEPPGAGLVRDRGMPSASMKPAEARVPAPAG